MIPAWTTSAPPVPGLGYLTTLAVDPSTSSTLLAGGDVHGLKRTTDAGHLWEQIDTGTWKAGRYGIAAIAPHPNTPGKYYVLSGSDSSHGGVYVTTNYGDDWRLLAIDIVTQPQTGSINGQPVLRVYGRLLALDASGRHDVLYAASYSDGLYKSTDGGAIWTNIAFAKENKNLTAVVLHPTVPSTVYVGWRANTTNWSDTTGGIKVSTDGGQHWSDLLTGVPVRDLVIDPNQTTSIYVAALTGGVYRSLKGIWSHPNTGLPLTTPQGAPTYFNAIEVNPNKLGHVLVGTGEGNTNATNGSVYSSLDRAGSWTNLVTSTNVHIDDTVIVPSFYYLGGNGDAISAVVVPKPPPNQPPPPLSSTTIWVSGRSLAWYSPDGGANWFPSSAGLEGAGRHFDVAVDPATGSLYMGTGDWVLIRSDAARQVFELVPLSFPQGEVRSLCFAFTTTRLLLGAGSSKDVSANNWGGVFRSPADGQPASTRGTSWSLVGGLPSARVVGLAAAPSKPDVVYAAVAKNGVYKSTDGGTTFAAMSASGLPNPTTLFPGSFTKVPIAVHPAEPNAVYLLDHVHGLFAYSPSAGTWTNVSGAVPITGTPVDANAPYQGFALDPLRIAVLAGAVVMSGLTGWWLAVNRHPRQPLNARLAIVRHSPPVEAARPSPLIPLIHSRPPYLAGLRRAILSSGVSLRRRPSHPARGERPIRRQESQASAMAAMVATGRVPAFAELMAEPELDLDLDSLFEFGFSRMLDGAGEARRAPGLSPRVRIRSLPFAAPPRYARPGGWPGRRWSGWGWPPPPT
jgi:hypothetical protein